jgi:hypothetical protein
MKQPLHPARLPAPDGELQHGHGVTRTILDATSKLRASRTTQAAYCIVDLVLTGS